MYLQITTKCNMKCAHCCYSCNKNGKHMVRRVWEEAIRTAADLNDETVSIGGGEPTLHLDFFDILKKCLWNFRYVWMATNGSRTKTMWRLVNILDGEDFDSDGEERFDGIYPEHTDQLIVALSLDYFHSPINEKVEAFWKMRAKNRGSGFEIRNVTTSLNGPIAQGRAIRTGAGWAEGCCCSDLIIRPDGKIKLCGCKNSPIVGTIWSGLESKWEDFVRNDKKFSETNCHNGEKHTSHR